MADTKISDLTAASALTGTEEFPCADGTATTKAATAAQVRTYVLTAAATDGMSPPFSLIRADSSRALTNATGDQKVFNSPTNGALTLATGTYLFEALIAITGMSATSGNAYFDLIGAGTATLGTILYHTVGRDNALDAAGGALGGTASTAAQTNANAVTAGTGTSMWMWVRGTFECTATGTVIPTIGLQTAAAATLAAGSYFLAQRIGDTTLTSVGDWA